MRGGLCCCGGLTGFAAGLVILALAFNLASYERLTHETKIAEIHTYEIAPQQFQAALWLAQDQQWQQLEIRGDEWQLDARILKWHAWANLLGLDTLYKLERLNGRYSDVKQAQSTPPSIHSLASEPGLSLWQWAQSYSEYTPFVDAYYGNATYLPMQDGAEFEIFVGPSGLIARPGNQIARDLLHDW